MQPHCFITPQVTLHQNWIIPFVPPSLSKETQLTLHQQHSKKTFAGNSAGIQSVRYQTAHSNTSALSVAPSGMGSSGVQNSISVTDSSITTPINVKNFQKYLNNYSQSKTNYLIQGFTHGFRIPYTGERRFTPSTNHPSVLLNKMIVDEKINSELDNKRILGPFVQPPYNNLICSPLGLVPKKDTGDYRLIHDLSWPKTGESVNEFIPKTFTQVSYETLDTCIEIITSIGRGCLVAKCDIQNAFRIVPIHPADWELLGFTWNGYYYVDKSLPMGLSYSCGLIERFSKAVQWILQNIFKVSWVSHILDDFIFFGPPHSAVFEQSQLKFLHLASDINIPIKASKTVSPNHCVILHGIEVDTLEMLCRLPMDKLDYGKLLIQNNMRRKTITLVELQSIIGTLNFYCKVIVPGRAFLRRLIDLTKGIRSKHHHINLTKEARLDLKAWYSFLCEYNGKTMFPLSLWNSSDTLCMYTDAAASKGYAGLLGSEWFNGHWPSYWAKYSIAVMELYPIVIAVQIWARKLQNKRIIFYTDNSAVAAVVNFQSSSCSNIMVLLRKMVLTCMLYNINFQARHIPGKHNVTTDLLSRFQVSQARRSYPTLNKVQTQVPEDLLPCNTL